MQTEPIYHITTIAEWEAAKLKGYYEAASLALEGFIHCSTEQQVAGVLERYYAGQTNLVKLTINAEKLNHTLRFELAGSVDEYFPHIFGPINLNAIAAVDYLM
ncbi:MAG: DUF952 domain-containing protein [Chitinophagaceae bacterium]|nr:DUF952 domain-containing protein [Chitinophagaceae bacterium]